MHGVVKLYGKGCSKDLLQGMEPAFSFSFIIMQSVSRKTLLVREA